MSTPALTPTVLRFSRPVARAPHPVGARCEIRQFRYTDFDGAMSPLVLVDHFVMTGPTFQLHPHAGMSAVTVLFEDTLGWMSSHDSVRNDHRIEPGDLHWTLAGAGIVHTQQPEGAGARLNGLQLFVNLPRRLKRAQPTTILVHAADVPSVRRDGVRLRVLAGTLEGKTSPLQPPEPILIVDGQLQDGASATLPLPAGWNLWLYARTGSLMARDADSDASVPGVTLTSGEAVAVSAGAAACVNVHAQTEVAFVAIAGAAIHEPLVQMGPFVMNSREEAEQAMADYQNGKFGTVASFV